MNRNLLFISHANPEDNEFSRWLALQLARCGYRVWCDLTRLLGGEDFWSDIEGAMRERTCKFLYVLSRTSNHRPGTLQELHLADGVARKEGFADFIIPLRIDALPHNEFNIQVARRNAIDFNGGWATGLNQLLEKLGKDKVPKDSDLGPGSVASWWKTQFAPECQIISKPEVCLSNMFPIVEIPSTLFAHELSMYFRFLTKSARYPFRRHQHLWFSFATASDLEQSLEISGCISRSQAVSLDELTEGQNPFNIKTQEARSIIMDLLRQAWEKSVDGTGMLKYYMSRRKLTAYFKNDFLPGNKVKVSGISNKNTLRNLIGYDTRKDRERNVIGKRYWHFSVQFKPTFDPVLAFTAIPHVLFSYDGENILSNRRFIHRLRRNKCRDWWNAEWRDRIMGIVQWLAAGKGYICFDLGSQSHVKVDAKPLLFDSDISYIEPESKIVILEDEEETEGLIDETLEG